MKPYSGTTVNFELLVLVVFVMEFVSGIQRPGNSSPVPPTSNNEQNKINNPAPPAPLNSPSPSINPIASVSGPESQQLNFPSPSRDILPPLLSAAPASNNFIVTPPETFPQFDSNPISNPSQFTERFPQLQQNFDKLELLPPIEIPPEFPIDFDNNPSLTVEGSRNRDNPKISFQTSSSASVQTSPNGQSSAPIRPNSFSPSTFLAGNTRTGPVTALNVRQQQSNSVDALGNKQHNPNFQSQRQSDQRPTPSRDPGLDCLGSCECPGDFNFVCGSNRFLYQNECALECDKRCHPDVIKVSMAHCSRKR